MRAVKSVSIDSERRVIITFLDGSTETLYPNCIWCDSEALRQLIKDLLEEKADAIVQTINNVAIATFADGADEALIRKLLVSIEPIQEGTGDPGPENVRPISGRTGLSVIRAGKNLLNLSGITIPTTALPLYVPIFVGENAVTLSSSAPTNTAGNANLFLLPGSVSSGASASTNGVSADAPRTVNAVDGYVTVAIRNHMGVNPIEYNNQLEIGSTASNYEPYKATEVSVNWETEAGTVYGGTLDVVSGKLTVDRAKCTMGGGNINKINSWYSVDINNQSWGCYLNKGIDIRQIISDEITGRNFVSNKIKDVGASYGDRAAWTGGIAFTNGAFTYLGIRIAKDVLPEVSSSTELNTALKNYLNANPIEFVFQITPTEIQLTPQEIATLLGTNNIWTDSGNILELEYVADTKLYIGESQSGTLGSGRQTISNTDLQPVSEKTLEDVGEAYKPETVEGKTHEESDYERG